MSAQGASRASVVDALAYIVFRNMQSAYHKVDEKLEEYLTVANSGEDFDLEAVKMLAAILEASNETQAIFKKSYNMIKDLKLSLDTTKTEDLLSQTIGMLKDREVKLDAQLQAAAKDLQDRKDEYRERLSKLEIDLSTANQEIRELRAQLNERQGGREWFAASRLPSGESAPPTDLESTSVSSRDGVYGLDNLDRLDARFHSDRK